MRDPDLVVRAQLAASALEGAWHRWRAGYGRVTDPIPAVSSYVGYSLEDPWGQPRVVFGLAAEDAEQLAALLERHDHGEPAYAAVTTQAMVRDRSARTPARPAPLPVPRQASSAVANTQAGHSLADLVLSGDSSSCDEPVYRQAAAAMKEAAAARELARRAKTGERSAPAQLAPDDSEFAAEQLAGSANRSDRPGAVNLVSPAWMGSLAMAATTAKAEAEARIRAAWTKPGAQSTEPSRFDGDEVGGDAGDGVVVADGRVSDDHEGDGDTDSGLGDVTDAGAEDGRIADGEEDRAELPEIYATDVLEPLPAAEEAGARVPDLEDPADGASRESRDHDGPDRDVEDADRPSSDPDVKDGDVKDADAVDQDASDEDARDEDADGRDLDGDGPERDDDDVTAGAPSEGLDNIVTRRGRVTRSYPIARLSKTKRSGAASQSSGS